MKTREDLADYIRRLRRAAHWSCSDISNRARQKGFAISTSYITRLENRLADPSHSSTKKLTALAAGLEVAPPEIFALARGESVSTPSARESSLLDMFRALPAATQEDISAIVKCLYQRRAASKKTPPED